MRLNRASLIAGLACSGAIILGAQWAMAQSLPSFVRAEYTVSVTDPASGHVWYVFRMGQRDYTSMEECQMRAPNFADRAVVAVQGFGLVNEADQSPAVAVDSIECIPQRQ